MKQIGQLVAEQNRAQSAASESGKNSGATQSAGSIKASWVDALFDRFHRIWAQKWDDQIAVIGVSEMRSEWIEGLDGMTGDQIKRALDEARKTCTWPPSIAEFRKLGIGPDDMTAEQKALYLAAKASDDAYKALPKETWAETKGRGKKALEGLRESLGW